MSRPLLTTERLRLEPLTWDHLEAMVELDSDPEVMRFISGRASPREVSVAWMPRRTRPEADARGLGYWSGYIGDEFLGWWSLALDDDDPDAAELGYRIRRPAWGHGYATEGARVLLGHGFDTVGLQRIWADAMAINTASRAVLEKVGLRLVREYVGEWDDPIAGSEQGEVVYELTREEWSAGS